MKLYELDNEYLDFITAVEDGTIPEDAIEDTRMHECTAVLWLIGI